MICLFCNDKGTVIYTLSPDEWRRVPCNICNAHSHHWSTDEWYGDWFFCTECDLVRNSQDNTVQIG